MENIMAKTRYTLAEAAVELDVAASTLRHQVQLGALRAELFGKTYVVTAAEIERYRREHKGRAGRPEGVKDSRPRTRSSES
jgi:hypothetical protein